MHIKHLDICWVTVLLERQEWCLQPHRRKAKWKRARKLRRRHVSKNRWLMRRALFLNSSPWFFFSFSLCQLILRSCFEQKRVGFGPCVRLFFLSSHAWWTVIRTVTAYRRQTFDARGIGGPPGRPNSFKIFQMDSNKEIIKKVMKGLLKPFNTNISWSLYFIKERFKSQIITSTKCLVISDG